jgi:YD repeat-containing protein
VQSALGWGYTYNQNGDVVTRTKGADSYTFTYTDFLKVETISRGAQVLHRFGYDANGVRVAERRSDGRAII